MFSSFFFSIWFQLRLLLRYGIDWFWKRTRDNLLIVFFHNYSSKIIIGNCHFCVNFDCSDAVMCELLSNICTQSKNVNDFNGAIYWLNRSIQSIHLRIRWRVERCCHLATKRTRTIPAVRCLLIVDVYQPRDYKFINFKEVQPSYGYGYGSLIVIYIQHSTSNTIRTNWR